MLDSLFVSVLNHGITFASVVSCTLTSLLIGFCIAFIYMVRSDYSKSFVTTLAVLPALVQIVIFLVNGDLGAGIAVAGAFSLVRFRSLPGTAREIIFIFFSVAVGIAAGMGYLGYCALFSIMIGAVMLVLNLSPFGTTKTQRQELKITVPENLEYEGLFDEILNSHTKKYQLMRVRTTNMGSLFELIYQVDLSVSANTKELMDALRCLNGNLSISLHSPISQGAEL